MRASTSGMVVGIGISSILVFEALVLGSYCDEWCWISDARRECG